MAINKNRTLTGNSGDVWLNGKLMAQIKKIEAKVTGNFEAKTVVGSYATYNDYTGWEGDGTLVMYKIDSTTIVLLAEAYKNGVMPDIKIITRLTDKATGKSERASISDMVFTEFMLAAFEAKTLIEEELPFKFSDYEILETI